MSIRYLNCPHCQTSNAVAVCPQDERPFVVTSAHVAGEVRESESRAVLDLPLSYNAGFCDYCQAKELGNPAAAVLAGMRQRTCPECKIEFLTSHSL